MIDRCGIWECFWEWVLVVWGVFGWGFWCCGVLLLWVFSIGIFIWGWLLEMFGYGINGG